MGKKDLLWRKWPDPVAKVGVVGSNPIARSKFPNRSEAAHRRGFCFADSSGCTASASAVVAKNHLPICRLVSTAPMEAAKTSSAAAENNAVAEGDCAQQGFTNRSHKLNIGANPGAPTVRSLFAFSGTLRE